MRVSNRRLPRYMISQGRPRRSDWTAPVFTSAEELANATQESNEPVFAMPSNATDAEIMWSFLAAKGKIDALFVIDNQTHEGFVQSRNGKRAWRVTAVLIIAFTFQ